MARCLNCIHCDVCDIDRREKEHLYGDCSDFLNGTDVVPKSEWNRIYTELEGLKSSTLPRLRLDLQMVNTKVAEADMAKAEVAREIFKEIERLMENNEVYFRQTDEMQEEFAELKNKYLEDKE